tara:strand:+ start:256 stop:1506 length:1251 start_codon:yes stop_codon:yes gene_type:complete
MNKILNIKIPGDKSIAHRLLILASFIKGVHTIKNMPKGEDVATTLEILKNYNLKYFVSNDTLKLDSSTVTFKKSSINCGNSGTTARLLTGYLSGLNIETIVSGSKQLSKRPMDRVVEPLSQFGANINCNNQLPLKIKESNNLKNFNFELKVPSAQIKSALILYALSIKGKSIIKGLIHTRDHLELLLLHLGYPISINKHQIEIIGGASISKKLDITIPGDFSTASFLICAALLLKGASIRIRSVNLNKYRIGFINMAIQMGGNISILNKKKYYGEYMGDIIVTYSPNLISVNINKSQIVSMIDEVPIFSVLSCYAHGTTIIKGVEELKVKESNRLEAICYNIQSMGGDAKVAGDSLIIKGKKRLHNTSIKSFDDHRIFMAFYIANHIVDRNFSIEKDDCYKKSFPEFIDIMNRIFV